MSNRENSIKHNEDDDEDSFFFEKKSEDQDQDRKSVQQIVTKSKINRQKKKKIRKEKATKRIHNSKEKQKELRLQLIGQKKAEAIIEEMNRRFEQDLELYQKKQLACKKLTYLQQLSKQLKNIYISQKFLQSNGLQMFEKWLSKVSVKGGSEVIEPSLALRKGIFQILLFLNAKSDHIVKSQELQRIIQKNKRSQIRQLREMSENIISKWSQLTYDDAE